ncbi:hypothetical protein CHARACLAT_022646, partial [Characodon lateralis]|nr:hypothetical protein [Characodon lateralis]
LLRARPERERSRCFGKNPLRLGAKGCQRWDYFQGKTHSFKQSFSPIISRTVYRTQLKDKKCRAGDVKM